MNRILLKSALNTRSKNTTLVNNRKVPNIMQNELFQVNQTITLASGAGKIDQSFQNVPDDKYALIELFSYSLKHPDGIDIIPEPIILWAYPAHQGPPRTKTLFFPLHKITVDSLFSADTYSIKLRLEPGDAWGVTLTRGNTSGITTLNVYISGYLYSADQ
jgi:hypothetical protein